LARIDFQVEVVKNWLVLIADVSKEYFAKLDGPLHTLQLSAVLGAWVDGRMSQ
jgi:hypothetical protein